MPENRDIKATKGIPIENIVVSEIPVAKAQSIGQLEAENKGKDNVRVGN